MACFKTIILKNIFYRKQIWSKRISVPIFVVSLTEPLSFCVPYRWKKKPVKRDQFFTGDQYFSTTNNFTRLKLKTSKYFLLSKNQITEILKKHISDLLYHNLVEWRWVGKGREAVILQNWLVKTSQSRGWSVKTGQLHQQ